MVAEHDDDEIDECDDGNGKNYVGKSVLLFAVDEVNGLGGYGACEDGDLIGCEVLTSGFGEESADVGTEIFEHFGAVGVNVDRFGGKIGRYMIENVEFAGFDFFGTFGGDLGGEFEDLGDVATGNATGHDDWCEGGEVEVVFQAIE